MHTSLQVGASLPPYDIGVKYPDFFRCLDEVVACLVVVIALFGGVFVQPIPKRREFG